MKVPCDTRSGSKIGTDGFIEIYAKEKEAESIELQKFDLIVENEDPRIVFPRELFQMSEIQKMIRMKGSIKLCGLMKK